MSRHDNEASRSTRSLTPTPSAGQRPSSPASRSSSRATPKPGIATRVYADLCPDEVAGVVLAEKSDHLHAA
ncbi:hypothetical protein ACIA03_00480 [Nocardioides sp. NPDC051685]|uniref:hypothetical protein n=1 Tax=Nocardioides sp. NPDC051685 TaxID=3364334 RepID=UPI00379AFD31